MYVHIYDAVVMVQFLIDGFIELAGQFKIS